MKHFIQRRVLAPLILLSVAGSAAVGVLLAYEAVTPQKGLRPRQLLYEPVTPKLQVQGLPAPQEHYRFTIDLNPGVPDGLEVADFVIEQAKGSATALAIEKVEYINRASAPASIRPTAQVLLFDGSDSILESDPQDARVAAGTEFVEALPASSTAAVAVFGRVPVTLLQDFTKDKEALSRAIEAIPGYTGGGTPLFASILASIHKLCERTGETRQMLVITDGGADDPEYISDVLKLAASEKVAISVVTLGDSSLDIWDLYKDLARQTGGRLVSAENAQELASAFKEISDTQTEQRCRITVLATRARRFGKGERLDISVAPGGREAAAYTVTVR